MPVLAQLVVGLLVWPGASLNESNWPSGCGVALTGDWPNPGAQFSEDYKCGDTQCDLRLMMQNAQAAVGPDAPPLWRYDWRATEHPYSGPWTYIAMDWCSGTQGDTKGRNEHPDPAGTSPGLLGWNEPNVPGQCMSNLWGGEPVSVAEFVRLARQFKEHGKFVVTPAPGGGSGWLDAFLGQCQQQGFLDIDYMSFHHYVPCDSGKYGGKPFTTEGMMYGSLMSELNSHVAVMNKYNNMGFTMKGIWLSEVACAPDGGWGFGSWRMDAPPILMDALLRVVKENPVVTAWAWFPYRQFGMLWDENTYELTDLGTTYFQNCHPSRSPTPPTPPAPPAPPAPPVPPPPPPSPPGFWRPCTRLSKVCCNPHTATPQYCPGGKRCQECGGSSACECPSYGDEASLLV